MTKITLNIPDDKITFFLELIQQLGFEVSKTDNHADSTKEEILTHIEESVEEMNLILTGKKAGRDAQELVQEF